MHNDLIENLLEHLFLRVNDKIYIFIAFCKYILFLIFFHAC